MEARERLLEAAGELLREGGVAGATARRICARAGVTAPALYYHFGDLSHLHEAAAADAFAHSLSRKRRARSRRSDRSQRDALRQGWDAYVAFARDEPAMFRVLAVSLSAGLLPEPARRSYEDLVRLVAEAYPLTDGTRGAQMLWCAAHGVACFVAGGDAVPFDRAAGEAVREAVMAALPSA